MRFRCGRVFGSRQQAREGEGRCTRVNPDVSPVEHRCDQGGNEDDQQRDIDPLAPDGGGQRGGNEADSEEDNAEALVASKAGFISEITLP